MNSPARSVPAFLEHGQRRRMVAPPGESRSDPRSGRRIPGEAGLWVFLLGDMTLFGLFFVVFASQMSDQKDAWSAGAHQLHHDIGTTNTLLLLVSSYLVARAVAAWRSRAFNRGRILMVAAACAGIGFIVLKGVEYGLLVSEGVSPTESLFFTYYFALTGIHLAHVIIGVVILLVCASRLPAKSERSVEGSASYWHMVDVLWVVLFPLLYFVGRI